MFSPTDLFLFTPPPAPRKFKIIGLISSPNFQKCRYFLEKLHACYPKEYAEPETRPMLNLDWDLYLTKMRRRHGKPYYLLKAPVVVYSNGDLLGDDTALMAFISEKYMLEIDVSFEEVVEKELIQYFENVIEKHQRKFAYLTIAIDEHVVGSMLFMLYNDLVPITCDNFLTRCMDKSRTYGYKGSPVHRIAGLSWIQCGGLRLDHVHMACENYAVPHDRRGVLSMCNKSRHVDNSTQFNIILEAAPWMDYNYVAFGQLIQGAEILTLIEKISTYYQSPTHKVEIVNCGEFSLCPAPDEDYSKALNPPYSAMFAEEAKLDDEADSILNEEAYKAGKYFLKTDLKSYLPFTRYSKMFNYLGRLDEEPVEGALKKIATDKEPVWSLDGSRPFYHKSDLDLKTPKHSG